MQEPNGKFGVRVEAIVEKLTEEYGNAVITCSKSGKLTKALPRIQRVFNKYFKAVRQR